MGEKGKKKKKMPSFFPFFSLPRKKEKENSPSSSAAFSFFAYRHQFRSMGGSGFRGDLVLSFFRLWWEVVEARIEKKTV